MVWHCFTKYESRVLVVTFACFTGLGRFSLRVIEVNTLEPRLKTLTPRQNLTRTGFQTGQVKVCGRGGEYLRDAAVMGFGEVGEGVRDSK
jgi:hypothetical protein